MYLDVAECMEVNGTGWVKLPSMSTPRSGAFAWTDRSNKKIYVAGGVSSEGGAPLSSVEILDVKTNTWSAGRKFLPFNSELMF
jgi:hypothetical protein